MALAGVPRLSIKGVRAMVEAREISILPKVYINAMPKSGLHALWLAILPTVRGTAHGGPWCGGYEGNGWLMDWGPKDQMIKAINLLMPGLYYKAHAGWAEWLDEALREKGCCKIFLYRDPRDVAVSQAYHCLSPDDPELDKKLFHPGKAEYQAINEREGLPGVLKAVLEGVGQWPGLFDRWVEYAPWLDQEWVLSLKYEDLIYNPLDTLSLMLRYLFGRAAWLEGHQLVIDEQDLGVAAKHCLSVMSDTDMSPSFRKGGSGGWQKAFTPELVDLTKALGGDWLIKLGYEQDHDWTL